MSQIIPMNAYQMGKNKSHIVFPAYGQPKLDGNRCLAYLDKSGQIILISRNGKRIQHLQQMRKDLKKILEIKGHKNLYLDGELHIDDSRDIGLLRRVLGRKTDIDKSLEKRVKFNIFDCFWLSGLDKPFAERWSVLVKLIGNRKGLIRLVDTFIIAKESDVDKVFHKMLDKGYEGLVLRNMNIGGYLLGGKRSRNVMTSKNFQRGFFEIIGFKEGLGKDKGTAIFKMKCLQTDEYFWARPMGSLNDRRKMFANGAKMIGKKVMVKYIELNKESGCITRNPVIEIKI